MRNNLLSLQQTAKLQDKTQNRLATGLKVNSAIDNPSSYYTAQSLNNRAEDLNILLDAMSQGIQTLKAVNESIEAGTKFLEQAKSVASSALETVQPIAARVSTEAELLAAVNSGKKGLIVLTSDITMSTNQNIVLNDGQSLVGARYIDKNAAQTTLTFNFDGEVRNGITIADNSIVADLDINFSSNIRGYNAVIYIPKDTDNIRMQNINIGLDVLDISGNSNTTSAIFNDKNNLNIKGYLNIIDKNVSNNDNAYLCGIRGGTFKITDDSKVNILISSVRGMGVLNATVEVYGKSELNVQTKGWGNSNTLYSSILKLYDKAQANIDGSQSGSEYSSFELNSSEVRLRINTGNNMAWWKNDTSAQKIFMTAAKGAQVITSSGRFTASQDNQKFELVKGTTLPADKFTQDTADVVTNNTDFKKVFDDFDTYIQNNNQTDEQETDQNVSANQFNQILTQYDMLINDSWYKGVNLLKSQDLKVVFNESRTADLDIKGVDATTKGLGLETADWNSAAGVQNSLDQIDDAINQLRLYASEFGNYYQIVTTRENFTNALINVLTEGADALTLADMNQESANMLALQTRQQLAVNSLSLASQASQSVLKLF